MSPDTADVKEDSHSTWRNAMATTRAEVAALHSLLLPISTLSTSAANLHPVSIGLPLDNPFELDVGPCESIVVRARTLFDKKKGFESIWCQNHRNRSILGRRAGSFETVLCHSRYKP